MNEFLNIITRWANEPYVTHDDVTKCGQCWRETIQSGVAKEFLTSGKEANLAALEYVLDESKNRWRKTDLYIRVSGMMNEGKNLKTIEEELKTEGIEI